MHIIGCVATKGGVGKTTIASCLAVMLATPKTHVALLDMDPQQSLADWWQRRGCPDNPQLYSGADTLPEAVEALAAVGPEYVIADSGPGLLHKAEELIDAAAVLVVPVKASALDLVSAEAVLEIVEATGKPYLIVLNECLSAKMNETARELLEEAGHPVAKTAIKQRVAYRAATTSGHTGPEADPKAAEEIVKLLAEVRAMLRKDKPRV